jgi:hypothetical protein
MASSLRKVRLQVPQVLAAYRANKEDTLILFFLIGFALTGQLITGEYSQAAEAAIPRPILITSIVLLALGSFFIMAGSLWRGRNSTALEIEVIGRVIVAPGAAAYALVITDAAGLSGGITIAFLIALSVTSIVRVRRIFSGAHEHEVRLVHLGDS